MNDPSRGLSRRDFLKLSGLGLLGLMLPGRPLSFFSGLEAGQPDPQPFSQGRVTTGFLWAHDTPSDKGKRVKMYWRDLVVNIVGSAIDEDTSAYNRVWYQLDDGSYLYSGWVQPVRTLLNEAVTTFPKEGLLGEVSVPFTDAYALPNPLSKVTYRLYYETTHWVMEAVKGADKNLWYRLLDDKFNRFYYVPAKHVRILPEAELTPLSPSVPAKDKRIEVYLNQQVVLAYEADRPVFAVRAATGAILRSGRYTTPVGVYTTFHKRPTRHMANGDIAASGFDLPGVPWVLYITDSGISLHGTYWHNDFGHPRSHGCVNISPSAAKWLFRWSLPTVAPEKALGYDRGGTTVTVIA